MATIDVSALCDLNKDSRKLTNTCEERIYSECRTGSEDEKGEEDTNSVESSFSVEGVAYLWD
jgi:hypothetical protein